MLHPLLMTTDITIVFSHNAPYTCGLFVLSQASPGPLGIGATAVGIGANLGMKLHLRSSTARLRQEVCVLTWKKKQNHQTWSLVISVGNSIF